MSRTEHASGAGERFAIGHPVQFGRIGDDRDPWFTRRLWLHAAVVAPLIATAVAGAAIAIYVGFGGEAKAEKNVPLSGVGVLAGAVYAAVVARRMNGRAGWPLRAALVAAIVVVVAWLISLTLVTTASAGIMAAADAQFLAFRLSERPRQNWPGHVRGAWRLRRVPRSVTGRARRAPRRH